MGKGIKKLLKFTRNQFRFLFHSGILIPRKCPRKTHYNAQCPPGPIPTALSLSHSASLSKEEKKSAELASTDIDLRTDRRSENSEVVIVDHLMEQFCL